MSEGEEGITISTAVFILKFLAQSSLDADITY
jgi:hypothetical protein